MKIPLTLFACGALSCTAFLPAAEPDLESPFKAGKCSEAHAAAKELLKSKPDDDGQLFNGGMAAHLAGDFKGAIELWEHLRSLDPQYFQVRTKLVQAYEATKDKGARDQEIAEIHKLYIAQKDTELKDVQFFCRDQFTASGRKVMVFEYFELLGDHARKWSFNVLDDAGKVDHRYTLGSYKATTAYARESGAIGPNERQFHLDGYFDDGKSHRTYGFFKGEPPYDEIKKMVTHILEDKAKPISGMDLK